MKKVFVLFAVAAMIVACNKPKQETEETVDSVATEVVETVDSTASVVDSTLNAAADSVVAAVN
ncbi:MAG: hypothetical protein ACK5KP_03485 [Paludibacteraceae bacterium]